MLDYAPMRPPPYSIGRNALHTVVIRYDLWLTLSMTLHSRSVVLVAGTQWEESS